MYRFKIDGEGSDPLADHMKTNVKPLRKDTSVKKLFVYLVKIIACSSIAGMMALTFASASTYAHSTTQRPQKSSSHCVATIEPIKAGQRGSSVDHIQCYRTFQEAISAATNGRVHLAKNVRSADITQAMLQPTSQTGPFSSNVIAILYDDSNWNTWDGDFVVTTSGPQCSSTVTYGLTSLSPYGWNDRISSVHDFYGCNLSKLWEDDYYGGASDNCYSCTYVGDAMNDRTSSLYWRH